MRRHAYLTYDSKLFIAQIRQVRRRHFRSPRGRHVGLTPRGSRPEGMASAAFGKRPREEGEVEEGEVAETAVDAPRSDAAASAPAVAPSAPVPLVISGTASTSSLAPAVPPSAALPLAVVPPPQGPALVSASASYHIEEID